MHWRKSVASTPGDSPAKHGKSLFDDVSGQGPNDEHQATAMVFVWPLRQYRFRIADMLYAMHDTRRSLSLDLDQALDAQNAIATGGEQHVNRFGKFRPRERLLEP